MQSREAYLLGGGGGGGGYGTGDVPIATNADPCPATVALPVTMPRSDIAVRTTSNARRNVKTRFFI